MVEEETETGYRIYGYKVQGIVQYKRGDEVSGELSGFSGGYDTNSTSDEISGSASIYGISANGKGKLGGLSVAAEGSVFKAEVTGIAGLYNGSTGKYGFKLGAEAKAIALDGSYSPSFRIFGLNIEYTVGASVGSAHAGGRVSAFYDQNTKEGEISAMGHFGFGAGAKYGFTISNTNQEFN